MGGTLYYYDYMESPCWHCLVGRNRSPSGLCVPACLCLKANSPTVLIWQVFSRSVQVQNCSHVNEEIQCENRPSQSQLLLTLKGRDSESGDPMEGPQQEVEAVGSIREVVAEDSVSSEGAESGPVSDLHGPRAL